MGYRVVDDYVKQGASVANTFSNPSRGRSAASEQDLSKMTERMMQYASDFTSLWYDAMGLMMGHINMQPRDDAGKGTPNTPGATPPTPTPSTARSNVVLGHSRIMLDVKSTRPIEVIVALDESLHAGTFAVETLKARTGKSQISGVRVEPASEPEGPLKVRVHLAKGVVPERYTGAILDAASGKPKGRITVIVGK